MRSYDHRKIEKKWQEKWQEGGHYATPQEVAGKENYYALIEYPYPSGNLHIGHWYAFAVPDIFARFKRMKGYNVLFPIGFDAFGLPAENAAIQHGLDPREWTYQNIARMSEQLRSIGTMFDWSRQVITSDPGYYRWTQWLFLQLYRSGLAYRKKAMVNWDPVDKTVLANEQVQPDGTAERSGALVEKKELEQWFLRITTYADRLIDDLEGLPWPEEIKQAQRAWIGRSEGAEIDFPVGGTDKAITVFTTRPDTLFGATYLVLAPEHPLVRELQGAIENYRDVHKYVETALRKSELDRARDEKEKTGIRLEGVTAVNPATNEAMPVFVADYVLSGYGTGAIMAVPAHDERDFAFAKKFGLSVRAVITGGAEGEVYTGDGGVTNSGDFSGLSSTEAKKKITEAFGRKKTMYKLRDWLVSRQRYWGCPIPIVYDPDGNPHPVPDEHLPWTLPTDVDFTPTGNAPLATSKELKERTERIFGEGWRPEVDTMDTFIDSSWYFLRYTDPHNTESFAAPEARAAWMPVDRYSGGAEHTTMHLLYSRFFHKALYDLTLVGESEPYCERFNRGLILGTDGRKMSKRWGNVIDPDEQVAHVGADSVRIYLGFIGPYHVAGNYPWDIGGLVGVRRFLERVVRLSEKHAAVTPPGVETELHRTIQKVGEDIAAFKFNTAISQMMILVNVIEKNGIAAEDFATFLKVFAPFAPHLADELWEQAGKTGSIHAEAWPAYDEGKLVSDTMEIAVQVNGKVRATIIVPSESSEKEVSGAALAHPQVAAWIAGKDIQKTIYVKHRLLSIVVAGS